MHAQDETDLWAEEARGQRPEGGNSLGAIQGKAGPEGGGGGLCVWRKEVSHQSPDTEGFD